MSETSTTSWGETKTGTPASVIAALLDGQLTHEWDLWFGSPDAPHKVPVVYRLFPRGTSIDIDVKTSGLDPTAKRSLGDLFTLAHALVSFDGWTWNGELDEKIAFLRGLSDPLWALFVEEHQTAKLKQFEDYEKRRKLLGKSTPDRK